MKKIYINPEMEIVKMQTMTVLAGSPEAEITEETISKKEEWDASRLIGSDNEDW